MTWWSKIQTMILSGCHVYIHSHCLNWYSNILYDAICSKWKTKIWSPTQNIHIVFLGWVQYLKVQWGLGGVWNGSCVETFLLPPPRNVLHSSEVQEFAMFTGLFCARLAGFPCQLGEKTIHCSCSCCTRNVWTTRYEFSEHRFFSIFLGVQSRFSLRLEDLMAMMRSGKSSTKSLGSTVSSAGTVEWWVDFNWPNRRLFIEPLVVLCQVNCCILNWIYLHILITHCTMTITISCLYECTLIVCIYVYTARIYSQCSTFLLDFTLDTPRITNFEHFSTFKHLKKVFYVS